MTILAGKKMFLTEEFKLKKMELVNLSVKMFLKMFIS